MTKQPAKRTPVTAEAGIAPLCAIHQIIYGNAQVAAPGSFFVPVSEGERNELLGVDEDGEPIKGRDAAARELNEVELLVAEKMGLIGEGAAPTSTAEPKVEAPAAPADTETPASPPAGGDSDVIA